MSADFVIRAEGLGKKYLIGHQDAPERYPSLRDAVARGARNLARSARDVALGRQLVGGDRVEEFWALRDLDFQIKRGDVIGVIGRNGAGKSTLLKILSRITEPTTGRVEIHGRVASLLEVGTGFHPELTGRENIFLNGAILGMSRAEIRRKFDEIVAFAEVEQFLDTPVKRYSSGMYVRLAFAVAAHLEPEILVVDEVLAVGDAEFQKKCLGKMNEVAGHGRTIIFVSHNVNAIRQLCKTALFLEPGKPGLYFDGTAEAISLYMNAGHEALPGWDVGESDTWRNAYFAPVQIQVQPPESSGLADGRHPQNEPLVIDVTADVEVLDPVLTIGFDIISVDGIHVCCTYPTDDHPEAWPRLKLGRNRLRLTIPGGMLNEGEYALRLVGGLHNRQWLFNPNDAAPSITVRVSSPITQSPYWQQARRGVVAPLLRWEALS